MSVSKPAICIIGCGKIGTILLKHLVGPNDLILIDQDVNLVQSILKEYAEQSVTVHSGDATSAYFLRTVLSSDIYQILITLEDDALAIEVATILCDVLKINNIIVCFMESQDTSLLQQNIIVTNATDIVAHYILNKIRLGENSAFYVGKGIGEIKQIQLTASSPLVGQSLKSLPPLKKWLIGAIYRPKTKLKKSYIESEISQIHVMKEDELIIPSGNTRPKAGDKLLLIGEPEILKATSQYLKHGSRLFPTRYGEMLISLCFNRDYRIGAYREYRWLLKHMISVKMLVMFNHVNTGNMVRRLWKSIGHDIVNIQSKKVSTYNFVEQISKIINDTRIGLLICQHPLRYWHIFLYRYWIIPLLLKVSKKYIMPIWYIKTSSPIQGITLFVSDSPEVLSVTELVIDIVLQTGLPLSVLQVIPPMKAYSDNYIETAQSVMSAVKDMCALYHVNMQATIIEGHPVHETLYIVPSNHVLALSVGKENTVYWMIPNSAKLLIKKFQGSLLLLAN